MNESLLYKISLAAMILGLSFLYIYAEEVQLPVENNIEYISPSEKIRIEGVLTKLSQSEKVMFLQVQGERIEQLDVVFFPKEEIFLHQGDMVEIQGTVEEFQGKKEIIAEEIIIK